ncbi:MAG: hypothetical protein RLN82_07895 [Pseudomonadales bacterium]
MKFDKKKMSKIDRRRYLKLMAGVIAAAGIPAARQGLAAQGGHAAGEPVVDTHLHCFAGADSQRFPYHEQAPYRPAAAPPLSI